MFKFFFFSTYPYKEGRGVFVSVALVVISPWIELREKTGASWYQLPDIIIVRTKSTTATRVDRSRPTTRLVSASFFDNASNFVDCE